MSAKLSNRNITVLVAFATFLSLTAISAVVWAVTREAPPAQLETQAAAAPVQSAAMTPVVEQHDHPEGEFERITAEELKALLDKDQVIIIDVRSPQQYVAMHLPDALHIPVASIEGEIQYFDKGKMVVTYCTCPAEESSGQAAMILQHNGVKAAALKGGLDAWTSHGYPTVAGLK